MHSYFRLVFFALLYMHTVSYALNKPRDSFFSLKARKRGTKKKGSEYFLETVLYSGEELETWTESRAEQCNFSSITQYVQYILFNLKL